MKCAIIIFFILIVAETTFGATCTYYRSTNRITCGRSWWGLGGVTCSTAVTDPSTKLPAGYYYLGDYGYHDTWFKLYRQRNDGGFWDYHTEIPELSCRAGFALHPGSTTRGCITVTDHTCYDRLKNEITKYQAVRFTVYECLRCYGSQRRCGETNTISRLCTTDLEAV